QRVVPVRAGERHALRRLGDLLDLVHGRRLRVELAERSRAAERDRPAPDGGDERPGGAHWEALTAPTHPGRFIARSSLRTVYGCVKRRLRRPPTGRAHSPP